MAYRLTPRGGGGGSGDLDAQYVVLSADAELTSERVLTAGNGVIITDAGAGSTVTLSLDLRYLWLNTIP